MGPVILTRERKLAVTIGLFVLGVLMVALAAATETVAPLFVAWIPLAGVAWVLTRPEPGMAARVHDVDEETELDDEDADELDADEEPTELLPGDTRTDAEADGEDVDAG
jgi:hypothetical protein